MKTLRIGIPVALGAFLILLAEGAILFGKPALKVWVTPLCWTGYILLVDSYLYQKRGSSLMQNHPWQMLLAVPISTGLWTIFEGYNLLLKNWEYLHLPAQPLVKYTGFFWSFGTILPALLETNDLLEAWGWCPVRIAPSRIPKKALLFSVILGTLFLIYPLWSASPFDFPPVWLGFIFLLEPVNYLWGEESLLRRLEEGKLQRLLTLMISGGVMGLLWEFWNFWAGTKWVYHVPVPLSLHIFEMPLLGFLGFFPFGVEFYVMYHAVFLCATPLYKRRRSGGRGS